MQQVDDMIVMTEEQENQNNNENDASNNNSNIPLSLNNDSSTAAGNMHVEKPEWWTLVKVFMFVKQRTAAWHIMRGYVSLYMYKCVCVSVSI